MERNIIFDIGKDLIINNEKSEKFEFHFKKKTLKAEPQTSSFPLKLYIPQLRQAQYSPHILRTMTVKKKHDYEKVF